MRKQEQPTVDVSKLNLGRIGHNFLMQKTGGSFTIEQLNSHIEFLNNCLQPQNQDLKKYKVGVMMVCINQNYWPYAFPVIDGVKKLFALGHDVEIMMWSDMPNYPEAKDVNYGTTIFPTQSVEWPYPTLFRYHMFLKQEEYLKKFDYIFYIDLDMRIVNTVGDEIFGEGLTSAQHPMYAVRRELIPPYEPNPASEAYIPRPGRLFEENGKTRFESLYYAGGFQGGKTELFIEAMKEMKAMIDRDGEKNYIPIWNDESIWNKYLFNNPPAVVLSPSYIYPDSMIQEYYIRVWGRDYTPRIVTLTKPFSLSKEGGTAAQKMMQTM